MTRAYTTTCRSHCSTCNTCFSSDTAFDFHRIGKFEGPYFPGKMSRTEGPRRCDIPSEELLHEEGTKKGERVYEFVLGECRISDINEDGTPNIKTNVPIWTMFGSREKAMRLRDMASDVGQKASRSVGVRSKGLTPDEVEQAEPVKVTDYDSEHEASN